MGAGGEGWRSNTSNTGAVKCVPASESPEELMKTGGVPDSTSRVSDSVGLGGA